MARVGVTTAVSVPASGARVSSPRSSLAKDSRASLSSEGININRMISLWVTFFCSMYPPRSSTSSTIRSCLYNPPVNITGSSILHLPDLLFDLRYHLRGQALLGCHKEEALFGHLIAAVA